MTVKLHGLVAATHTPFHPDGRLNLTVVERQAEHLHPDGVTTVFVGGSTGESLRSPSRNTVPWRCGGVKSFLGPG